MSCSPFEWTCARCGKTYTHPFFVSYTRQFWKDNKKRVGEVCKECCAKVDDGNVRRRAKKLAGGGVGGQEHEVSVRR